MLLLLPNNLLVLLSVRVVPSLSRSDLAFLGNDAGFFDGDIRPMVVLINVVKKMSQDFSVDSPNVIYKAFKTIYHSSKLASKLMFASRKELDLFALKIVVDVIVLDLFFVLDARVLCSYIVSRGESSYLHRVTRHGLF
ncbi:uncharacterized protein LOC120009836 isoform X2 [Tripterygium wilfordii]|uniref:uncharacterized protein LOC120009836 isoform X2 n=1 Tax=Tripterygium wilfordii TaxID=458696 RepID=UPI0018F7F8DE|nr:uncharacterized protein LOC120009836 isoform X2 [Tripterygium wilfordii]